MSLHYRPVVPTCCSGSYFVEYASNISYLEKDEYGDCPWAFNILGGNTSGPKQISIIKMVPTPQK